MMRALLVGLGFLGIIGNGWGQEAKVIAGSPEAARVFTEARAQQQARKYSVAVQNWQYFLQQFPNDPAVGLAFQGLGACQLELGQAAPAAASLQKALQHLSKGQDESARWNLALALGRQGEQDRNANDLAKAAALCAELLDRPLTNEKRALVFHTYGNLVFAQAGFADRAKNYQEAAAGYAHFLQKFPADPRIEFAQMALVDAYLALRQSEAAEKLLAQLELRPRGIREDWLLQRWAQALTIRGAYAQAADKWAQVAQRYPLNTQAKRLRAEALSQVPAQRLEALEQLKQWAADHPQDPAAIGTLYRAALVAQHLEEYDQAHRLALAVRAKATDPLVRAEASYLAAQSAFQLQQWERAHQLLQEFLQADPHQRTRPELQLLLARCLRGLNKPAEALTLYSGVLSQPGAKFPEPERVHAEAALAALAVKKDLNAQERGWLKFLADKHSQNIWTAEATLHAAQHAAGRQKYAEAHDWAVACMKTQSKLHRPHALYLAGISALHLKKNQVALGYLQLLLDHHADQPRLLADTRYAFAVALQMANHTQEAQVAFQQFLAFHRDHPMALKIRQPSESGGVVSGEW